jgi:long-chain acyl-CoA synthetase
VNIYQRVVQNAKKHPEKVAICFETQHISYKSLIQQTDKLAALLVDKGVTKGTKIALFCANDPNYARVMLAAAKLYAVVVPLPLSLKGEALTKALEQSQVSFAIAWFTVAQKLLDNGLLAPSQIVSMGKALEDCQAFEHIMQSAGDSEMQESGSDSDNLVLPYILTLTSGSTGQPKPIIFSQATKIKRALVATADYYRLDQHSIVLVSTPLYHSLAQRSLLMPLMLGAKVVILAKFSVEAWCEAIKQFKVTFLFAVSSQLSALLSGWREQFDLSSLYRVVSSSAKLDKQDKARLLERLNCHFHECYGASELGVVSDFDISGNVPIASVGKPLSHVAVKIVGEQGETLPAREVGEIVCRSDTLFEGYFNLPEQTAECYDLQGYFRTGDLGYLDENGYLYFSGRKKEMIKSGGISIFPSDVEVIYQSMPDIEECAVIAAPDDKFGEVLCLVYVLKAGSQLTKVDLMKKAMQELLDYQQPHHYVEMKALPKTELGKVLKPQIKQQLGFETELSSGK